MEKCDKCHKNDAVMGRFEPSGSILMASGIKVPMLLCKECHDVMKTLGVLKL